MLRQNSMWKKALGSIGAKDASRKSVCGTAGDTSGATAPMRPALKLPQAKADSLGVAALRERFEGVTDKSLSLVLTSGLIDFVSLLRAEEALIVAKT